MVASQSLLTDHFFDFLAGIERWPMAGRPTFDLIFVIHKYKLFADTSNRSRPDSPVRFPKGRKARPPLFRLFQPGEKPIGKQPFR